MLVWVTSPQSQRIWLLLSISATHKTSKGPKNRGDIQYLHALNTGDSELSRTRSSQQSTSMLPKGLPSITLKFSPLYGAEGYGIPTIRHLSLGN